MFDLLLIDMVGILDEDHTPAVLGLIRDRLRLPRMNVDLVSEEFFMRTVPGRVAPVAIEQAINELEAYIWEGWQGEMALDDFLIVLVIDQRTPGPFILQVLGEMRQRTALLPAVLPLEIRGKGSRRIALGERRDLPLQWRCFQGDTVVLITDVWLAGECEENGDPPAFPRGAPLTIVERAGRRAEQENGDTLLAVAMPEGSDTPLSVELPWVLVAHPSEWRVEQVPSEPLQARATVQLYGWLTVRVDRGVGPAVSMNREGERDHGTLGDRPRYH